MFPKVEIYPKQYAHTSLYSFVMISSGFLCMLFFARTKHCKLWWLFVFLTKYTLDGFLYMLLPPIGNNCQ
jgi:hypothetical protein